MNPNEYQKLCMRTANKLDGFKLIVNGAMVMQKNIDKLKKRYPNGFEVERSVNRGDAQEAGD